VAFALVYPQSTVVGVEIVEDRYNIAQRLQMSALGVSPEAADYFGGATLLELHQGMRCPQSPVINEAVVRARGKVLFWTWGDWTSLFDLYHRSGQYATVHSLFTALRLGSPSSANKYRKNFSMHAA
jgi:hypothetical protein